MSDSEDDADALSLYNFLQSEITRRLKVIAKGTGDLPAPYEYAKVPNDPSVVIYRTINQVFKEHKGDIRDIDSDEEFEEDLNDRMHGETFVYSPRKKSQKKKSRRGRTRRVKSSKGTRASGKSSRKKAVCVPKKKKV